MLKVYQEPLTAALNSNRAILSYADIQIVLSPVTQILELNRYIHTHTFVWNCLVCVHMCGNDMIDVHVLQGVSDRFRSQAAAVGCRAVCWRCVCKTVLKTPSLHQLPQQLHHCPPYHRQGTVKQRAPYANWLDCTTVWESSWLCVITEFGQLYCD